MTCSCDYEQPRFLHIQKHKVRKEKTCYECGRTIEKGELYERTYGAWDEVCVFNLCVQCFSLRDYVIDRVPCFCVGYGNLLDEAMETVREYAAESPGLFFGAARLYIKSKQIGERQRINK